MVRESEETDRPPRNLWRSDDDEEEDPLIALGHMLKLASIGIWRRVLLKDKKTRPGMQERSNSDSVLEVGRSVPFGEADDQVLLELVDEETDEDKSPLPQTETPQTTVKSTDDEVVVVQTQVTPTVSIPTGEA